jgi:hypothetical protein
MLVLSAKFMAERLGLHPVPYRLVKAFTSAIVLAEADVMFVLKRTNARQAADAAKRRKKFLIATSLVIKLRKLAKSCGHE